jgi:hypothetical protein
MMCGFCHFLLLTGLSNRTQITCPLPKLPDCFTEAARLIDIRTVDVHVLASVRRELALQAIRHKKCTYMLQLYHSKHTPA